MKIKKIIVSLITMLCIFCAFAFTACVNNDGKDDPKTVYYTVTFYANNGLEEGYISKSVESGKTAADKVPVITHTGYVFDGWCTDEGLTQDFDIENMPVTSDISLYARWKKENTYDRAWFLSELEKCAANASSDGIARTTVSYKARIDGASAQSFTSTIENGGVAVGSYDVRLIITAEWFENEFLHGVTVTSETYSENTDGGFSARVHYGNGENQKYVYSFNIDQYGYVSGCSEKIDNGTGEVNTSLYVVSSIQYE